MSEFMEKFSRRLRRALQVYGTSRTHPSLYSDRDIDVFHTLRLNSYVIDIGVNRAGRDLLVLWISEPGYSRSFPVYTEEYNQQRYRAVDWPMLVEVSEILKKMLILEEIADI